MYIFPSGVAGMTHYKWYSCTSTPL